MQKLLSGYIRGILAVAVISAAAGMGACKKEMPGPVHYDTDTSTQLIGGATLKKRKVLLIGIDGAPGRLVKSFNPAVISGLLPQSVYTWDGLTDSVSTVAAGWTGMITGVQYGSHQIGDSTLIPKSVEGSHAEIKYYNSFIHYLKEDDINTKVTAITAWDDLTNFVLNNADRIIPVSPANGDKAVSDAAVKELSTADPDVVVLNFNSPAIKGLQAGFNDNPVYRQAVTDVDGYIGKVLDALKARKGAASEDWLVVIQSTSGGVGSQMGGRTGEERNSFTIINSPLITPRQIIGPPLVNSGVHLFGGATDFVRAVNQDDGLYNIGNGSLTIDAKIKVSKGPNGNYQYTAPPMLTKCANRTGSTLGWSILKAGDKVSFYLGDGSRKLEISTPSVVDGNYHSFTVVASYRNDPDSGHTYSATIYFDGLAKASGSLFHSVPKIESPSPLVMGYNPSIFINPIDMYMADVRIWNTAIPENVALNYTNRSDIDAAHPYYKNLIGYWPCMEGSGNVFKDLSPSGKNFNIEGNYSWDIIREPLVPKLAAPGIGDVVPCIFGWMGISLSGSDKPPGINWIVVKGVK